MGASELVELAKLFGLGGLFIGYLIWREIRDERSRTETDRLGREFKREQAQLERDARRDAARAGGALVLL